MARMPARRRRTRPLHVVCSYPRPHRLICHQRHYASLRTLLRRHAVDKCCVIHAWVLMPERLALVLTAQSEGGWEALVEAVVADYAAELAREYCRGFRRDRGHVASRELPDHAAVLAAMREVELAPVAAGRAERPEDYPFSSAGWHLRGEADPVVIDHQAYVELGIDAATRRCVYRQAMAPVTADPLLEALHRALAARKAANR